MGKDYSYILFDLDGTLTDSGPGIKNGFKYTLERFGIEIPPDDQLGKFVGPPLSESFGNILGFSKEDTVKAISVYREYYFDKGVYENEVYPGIRELLEKICASGKKLILATSKAEHGTNIVLDHFDLRKYFSFVSCSTENGRITKTDVIRYAIERCRIEDLSRAVMIGDRKYDIESAKETGLESIGVLYGYGSREELENAGATYIASVPEDILRILGL